MWVFAAVSLAIMFAPTGWAQPVYGADPVGGYGGYGGNLTADGLECQCNSTSRPRGLDPVPNKVFLSTNPQLIANWTGALNPNLPKDVIFACSCRATAPAAKAENYILNANQTDPAAASAAECLGEEVMTTICAGLHDLSLFTCDTIWRDGVAGTTSDALARNDALMEAVHKLCAAEGGPCASTITFTDLPDEILPAAY
jgi:hypothetical protein